MGISRIGLNNTAMDTSEDPKNKIKAIVADRGTTVRTSPTDGLQTAVCEKQMSPAERAARVFKTMDEVAGFSADARLTREAAHER